ncbi:MAG: hypothetical protein Q8R36_01555 [bacterium]|nr:hypothetical protein [bacterium]
MFSPQVIDLIQQLEKVLDSFFHVKRLDGVQIESYRQDAPTVIAQFQCAKDTLSRNIVLTVKDNPSGCLISFEANAWLDDRANLKRWRTYKPFETIWVGPYTETQIVVVVVIALEKIFTEISEVERSDLINASDLQPLPSQ